MTFELPSAIQWSIHRVATCGRYHDSLHVIETQWSLGDLFDAHDVIDALDQAEHEAMERSRG